MPRLTQDERKHAIGMLWAGTRARHLATASDCVPATIRRFQQRPLVATVTQHPQIGRSYLRNCFMPAGQTATEQRVSSNCRTRRKSPICWPYFNTSTSPWTTDVGTRTCRVDSYMMALRAVHRWQSVSSVWCRQGERLTANCVPQADNWGTTNIMVWDGISRDHQTPLHVCQREITAAVYQEVLQTIAAPFLRNRSHQAVLHQDNHTPHCSQNTRLHAATACDHSAMAFHFARFVSNRALWNDLGRVNDRNL